MPSLRRGRVAPLHLGFDGARGLWQAGAHFHRDDGRIALDEAANDLAQT